MAASVKRIAPDTPDIEDQEEDETIRSKRHKVNEEEKVIEDDKVKEEPVPSCLTLKASLSDPESDNNIISPLPTDDDDSEDDETPNFDFLKDDDEDTEFKKEARMANYRFQSMSPDLMVHILQWLKFNSLVAVLDTSHSIRRIVKSSHRKLEIKTKISGKNKYFGGVYYCEKHAPLVRALCILNKQLILNVEIKWELCAAMERHREAAVANFHYPLKSVDWQRMCRTITKTECDHLFKRRCLWLNKPSFLWIASPQVRCCSYTGCFCATKLLLVHTSHSFSALSNTNHPTTGALIIAIKPYDCAYIIKE